MQSCFKYVMFLYMMSIAPLRANTDRITAISLKVGETHISEIAQVSDIVVGDEGTVVVELFDESTLIIKAIRPGHTELLVKYVNQPKLERMSVHVESPIRDDEQLQLKWLRQNMPELTIQDNDELVLIHGQLSEGRHDLLKQQAQRNPHWLLQIEPLPTPRMRMIELEVTILEVKRQYAKQLGIRWPGSYMGPQVSDSAANWLTLPIAVQSTLNLLEQNGHARILAEPKLIAMSGEDAEFLVGGEFPVPQVVGQGLQDVSFREYGIALTMSPNDLGDYGISTAIKAEISTIDPATSVNGVPGMLTRRVSSSITAASGELIVLSGLLSQEQSQQADLFPFLNQLPILGALFRSRDFRAAETELLVVVTPHFKSHKDEIAEQHQHARAALQDFREQVSCVGLYDGI